ncbi:MAG: hypothetical protein PWQ59_2238 [Thermoanaerobacterium sp.]|jgi:hypothetical protein|uniref:Uncharacterized protein n=1 Tax=Thermoanaerobacterium butyriciformans TaxID=1702242 RepID=A0ABS4NHG1_9THEO|nr:hypothetical protein [Thermoanaerobacterium butyriciformans]MBP2072445.1 hypothetical protein [Thermoanaerobacterium butyriciformans]MDI3478713.1 hypothetical protein [Thermoanaerobacterium sp.]MDN5318024.1 hypothetical protein [Thermoanaerobacterium sp.]WHE06975.1 hypothetical protein PGH24_12710 [Thermoanaerobacterium thermosaccharolyticum]
MVYNDIKQINGVISVNGMENFLLLAKSIYPDNSTIDDEKINYLIKFETLKYD